MALKRSKGSWQAWIDWVQNGCLVTRGDHENIRFWLVVANRYCFETDWWCP